MLILCLASIVANCWNSSFGLIFSWYLTELYWQRQSFSAAWHWGELLTKHKFTIFNRSDFLFRWHWSRLQTITSSSSWKTKYSEITGTLRHSFTSATRPSRKVAIIQNERILILTNYLWLFYWHCAVRFPTLFVYTSYDTFVEEGSDYCILIYNSTSEEQGRVVYFLQILIFYSILEWIAQNKIY